MTKFNKDHQPLEYWTRRVGEAETQERQLVVRITQAKKVIKRHGTNNAREKALKDATDLLERVGRELKKDKEVAKMIEDLNKGNEVNEFILKQAEEAAENFHKQLQEAMNTNGQRG